MASHEMRTTVTVIRGAVELLDGSRALPDTAWSELLDAADRQLAGLERLASNLLVAQMLALAPSGPRSAVRWCGSARMTCLLVWFFTVP